MIRGYLIWALLALLPASPALANLLQMPISGAAPAGPTPLHFTTVRFGTAPYCTTSGCDIPITATTAGNLLTVSVSTFGIGLGGGATISDSNSDAHSFIVGADGGVSTGAWVGKFENVSAGNTNVHVGTTASGITHVNVVEWTGALTSGATEGGVANGGTSTSTTCTSGTITSGDAVYTAGAAGGTGSSNDVTSTDGALTSINMGLGGDILDAYLVAGSTAAYHATWFRSGGGSSSQACVIVGIK